MKSKVSLNCKQCGVEFFAYPSELRKGRRFCSRSCSTTYRNTHDNPAWKPEVRKKISLNHADVSGENNPMYMRRGKDAPSYIDGRNSFTGEVYRKILLASGMEQKCVVCGSTEKLDVHHKDGNHSNNDLSNLTWVCRGCHNKVAHQYARDKEGRFVGSSLCSL